MPAMVNKVIKMRETVEIAAELARGVTVESENKKGEKIYRDVPPSLDAVKWLEEMRAGGKNVTSTSPATHIIVLDFVGAHATPIEDTKAVVLPPNSDDDGSGTT